MKILPEFNRDHIINASYLFMVVAWISFALSEDKNEKLRISYIIVGQIFTFLAYGLGSLATSDKIRRIIGSDKILMSWNPHSPCHNHYSGGATTTIEIYREKHLKSFKTHQNCISFISTVVSMLGVFWSLQILILNTGSELEKLGKNGYWYSAKNSLFTTVGVTFAAVLIPIGV
jgi:hypothetical protein